MTTANQLTTSTTLASHQMSAFPPGFIWGAASSAYQIEGATEEDGRAPSIWDLFAATPGKTYQGESGAVATDHYHRMPEDVALMAQLGLGAYRFSIAWPRVVPGGSGPVNAAGLDFYDRLVDELLGHNIEPIATLYHWDLPLALHKRGGWLTRDTAAAFADYAGVMAGRLGDRVSRWITVNEPWCVAYLGYGNGEHAPGMRDPQAAALAGHHVLLAHGLAVPSIRAAASRPVQVGITLNFGPVYAADESPESTAAAARLDAFSNRWFADPIYRGSYPEGLFADMGATPPHIADGDMGIIAAPIDFLGVNYYQRSLIRAGVAQNAGPHGIEFVNPIPGSTYTDMGWEVYPPGMTDLLVRLQRDYAPAAMMITENGAAYVDAWDGGERISDPERQAYIATHIGAVAEAILQGAQVTGYLIWSLTDNFEWAQGYSKRFGIVYVDYPSQRRIIKDSGHWYADFLASLKGQRG